ncbi:hypothetical protein AB0L40_21815 [Patulibacter sp. NPDC049589]|uniref:hypothetical protein n=1 Tax=Patulibacter sp. NPDC049589 TaxID=3154731 RepID=UPI00341F61FE
MPRTSRTPRALLGAPLLTVALGAALLAGPGAGSAAAAKHTPCPTTGKTIVKATSPNLRVWREGTTLKACTRKPGQRRYVRTLGTWSTATTVAAGAGNVAWTTARTTEAGMVDALATVDVRTGSKWLNTTHAAVAPDAATPASDDRVLRLLTDDKATTWVTSRGIVAANLRKIAGDERPTYYGAGVPGTEPFHVGRRYFLGDTTPAEAAAVAKGLAFYVGGDGDECGGVDDFSVRVPAWGLRPEMTFIYRSQDWTSTADYCH